MIFYAHSLEGADKDKWHTLADHLKDTGKLAGKFAAFFGEGAEILAQQAGLLHDLGKYSHEFQKKLQGNLSRVNHSTHGAKEAIERYDKLGYFLAYAIAGHHTGLANGKGYDGKRSALSERLGDKELPTLDSIWKEEIKLSDTQSLQKYLKNMKQCKGQEVFQCAFLIRMLFSCLIDADRLDTEMFFEQDEGKTSQRGLSHSLATLQKVLNSHLQGLQTKSASQLNNWRNKILTTARSHASDELGMFSLTVPTGGGKTLTSLAFALDHALKHGLRRVIYVIPYTNIIEQTADVFRKALGAHKDAVLEHHSGFVVDDAPRDIPDIYQGSAKLKLAMENWDAPIIVTTAVQFFESLFSARTSKCRKLHNIASSIVILDEVQTTPLHVLRPCVAVLNELALNYRTSIVLCTATQPALCASEFPNGFEQVRELAPEREEMFDFFKRVTIRKEIAQWSDDELIEQIKTREQVLCIVNNRQHARFLVDSLQGVEGVRLLTTLMCAKHRQKVLTEIRSNLKNGKPCRLIATSLVEAGVDIDFPTVFRAEAGLDSIAQAAGRCNREGKQAPEDSEVIIFAPDENWPPPLELKQLAQVTREILRSNRDVLDPEAINDYFEGVYWHKGDAQLDNKGIMQTMREKGLQSLPFEKIDQDFKMIDSPQKPIIITYDEHANKLLHKLEHAEHCGGIARALQPYLVQVPKYAFDAMWQAGVLEVVAEKRFDRQFVILTKDRKDLYHKDYGLNFDEMLLPDCRQGFSGMKPDLTS